MTLREQLLRDEGVVLLPYTDSVGKLTIGVGRNLDDVGISRHEAEVLLDNDINRATAAVMERLPWAAALGEVRFAVLVNMTFNMGIGGLVGKNPKALAACERGDYDEAAREMLDGPWKDQVGPRAHRLADQMRTGEWR